MDEYENYYNEHAAQARQHEDQRERITNIILSIAGALIGLITFSLLSIWSLAASISIIALGIFGFFFAGKHYERFKFQAHAKSWIARQRVHVFWEFVHLLIVCIGIGLTTAIIIKYNIKSSKDPIKVQIVNGKFSDIKILDDRIH